jgi:hypothetical protein
MMHVKSAFCWSWETRMKTKCLEQVEYPMHSTCISLEKCVPKLQMTVQRKSSKESLNTARPKLNPNKKPSASNAGCWCTWFKRSSGTAKMFKSSALVFAYEEMLRRRESLRQQRPMKKHG